MANNPATILGPAELGVNPYIMAGWSFAQLEEMKRDIVECLEQAQSENDVFYEADLEAKLELIFDAELEVLPDYF